MDDFKDKLINEAEKSIIKLVSKGFNVGYGDDFNIPQEFFEQIWDLLDKEKLQVKMKDILEDVIAEKLMNMIASEIATDIKKIMSNQDRREEVRAVARDNIKRIMSKG